MTVVPEGAVLTCAHDGCGCRVLVQSECHCPGAGQSYVCACGTEMVPVTE